MTLQERMIAVYLRQAKLPEVEREKLRLFLGLLLETMDEDESDEGPFPAAPAPAPKAWETGPAVQNGAAEETPVAPPAAPEQKVQEWKPEHPFVSRILRILERRELGILKTASEIGISDATLKNFLRGATEPRETTMAMLEKWIDRWEQDAGTADTETG